jgi:hypothetical protein
MYQSVSIGGCCVHFLLHREVLVAILLHLWDKALFHNETVNRRMSHGLLFCSIGR